MRKAILENNRLSWKEREVIERLAHGKVPKQIAHELEVTPATVSNRITAAMKRHEAISKVQLIYKLAKNNAI